MASGVRLTCRGEPFGKSAEPAKSGLGVVPINKNPPAFLCRQQIFKREIRSSGLATIASSSVCKCAAIRAIVAASKRSVLYSSQPPRRSSASMSSSVRSNRAIPGSTSMKLYGQSRKRRGSRRWVLQNEHHLKQSVPIHAARHLEDLQDFLDRKILVSVGVECHLPDAPQDLAERRVARQIGPQDDRICEHPHEALELDLVAVGDQRSDRNVVVVRVPIQKALKCREQRHEHRGAMSSAQGPDGAGQGPRELQRMPGAAPGPYFGPRPVRSQRKLGQPFELCTPIAQLLVGGRRSQPRALPPNEMPVLDAKLR